MNVVRIVTYVFMVDVLIVLVDTSVCVMLVINQRLTARSVSVSACSTCCYCVTTMSCFTQQEMNTKQ